MLPPMLANQQSSSSFSSQGVGSDVWESAVALLADVAVVAVVDEGVVMVVVVVVVVVGVVVGCFGVGRAVTLKRTLTSSHSKKNDIQYSPGLVK